MQDEDDNLYGKFIALEVRTKGMSEQLNENHRYMLEIKDEVVNLRHYVQSLATLIKGDGGDNIGLASRVKINERTTLYAIRIATVSLIISFLTLLVTAAQLGIILFVSTGG